MTVPEAHAHPVLGRYRLRRHKIAVKGGRLSIVAVAKPEELLARIDEHEFQRSEQMPYWAEVWPASVALARRLCRGPSLAGRHALDLGCGLGVAGAAAARMGASVCFADWVEDALAFALFNAEHNAPKASQGTLETRRFDWFTDELAGPYDLVLLADAAYEARNHAPLLGVLETALSGGGTALVADPYRATADAFLARAAERFFCETIELETWFPDRRRAIRLVQVTGP